MSSSMDVEGQLRQLADQAHEFSPEDLADKLNILAKQCTREGEDTPTKPPASKKARKAAREFDFSRYRQRYVALELMYVGTTYQGFAKQDCTDNTIEGALFTALKKIRLIPEGEGFQGLKYSRCGRTDKGVSALGQVIAILLRSSARVPDHVQTTSTQQQLSESAADASHPQQIPAGEYTEEGLPSPDQELDYARLINRALPPDIRVLGWTPVPITFNARFSAKYREYKYFIVNRDNQLNIAAMQRAAQRFMGQHDFRNFCKPDVLAVRSFERAITSFTLEPFGIDAALPHPSATTTLAPASEATQLVAVQLESGSHAGRGAAQATIAETARQADQQHQQPAVAHAVQAAYQHAGVMGDTGGVDSTQVYAFTIRGTAFLWHQVRCMVAVLLMIGTGLESEDIVSRLLDIDATPAKPTYQMANEEPLLLYACGFENLSFIRSGNLAQELSDHVRAFTDTHLVAAALTGAIAARLAGDADAITAGRGATAVAAVKRSGGGPPHVPLLKRPVETTVAERMRKHGIVALGGAPEGSRKVSPADEM